MTRRDAETRGPLPVTLLRTLRKHRFLILLFPIYLVLDWISGAHLHQTTTAISWAPLSGLSLFVLLRWGWTGLPVLCLAHLTGDLLPGLGLPTPAAALWADAVVLGSSVLAWIAFRRVLVFDFARPTLRRTLIFILVAAGAALLMALTWVVATGGAGSGGWIQFILAWSRRYVGDFIGILTTLPCLAIVDDWLGQAEGPSRLSAVAVVQALLIATIAAVLFGWPEIDEFKTFYLLFIPVIWVSVTDGIIGAALVIFVTQLALFGTLILIGDHPTGEYGATHLMVVIQAVTGLLLGTVVA
ncbi:MAG: MASE1 domain-containing protein, partial [Rhodospirillaceae bacterium]